MLIGSLGVLPGSNAKFSSMYFMPCSIRYHDSLSGYRYWPANLSVQQMESGVRPLSSERARTIALSFDSPARPRVYPRFDITSRA